MQESVNPNPLYFIKKPCGEPQGGMRENSQRLDYQIIKDYWIEPVPALKFNVTT